MSLIADRPVSRAVDVDLEVRDLVVRYGDVTAVSGISLAVPRGSVVVVLGPNGAGKTSTLRAMAGGLRAHVSGDIELFGERVTGRPAHRIVARGMVLVPEGRQMIAPLTVQENLLLGAYQQRSRARVRAKLAEVHELFPVLRERHALPAGVLSGGEQQMLAFGRALMAEPRLILMDEPSMGLSPLMVDRIMDAVLEINGLGTSILLVEQNAAAFRVASHAFVLDQGRIVSSGTAAEVQADPLMRQAFLGRTDVPSGRRDGDGAG
jgi:branched-chain amino acid transport system ATP-binding protein